MKNLYSPYYVYLHKTLEGNPFYIGIGTKFYGEHLNPKMRYARAYSKTRRTAFWRKIVSKYGYEVEILVESTDYDYIKEQEKYFIKKYGRRNLKEGCLCNLTDGGEGVVRILLTKENLENFRKAQKLSYERGTSVLLRPGFYDGHSERMKGNTYAKGQVLTTKQKENLFKNRVEKLYKRVIQEDLEGNFIKEWYLTTEVAEYYKVSRKAVWKACNNYHKGATSVGFKWRFKEE